VIAAVQVARMGKEVILVSPDKHLGGLSSSGLGWTDTGDKAVIFTSASGLLILGLNSVFDGPILLGASKTQKDGKVEAGFAYVSKDEIKDSPFLVGEEEAVEMFRAWATPGGD